MTERIPINNFMSSRVRKARTTQGLSQQWLAQTARVPRARIKRIECNELQTVDLKEYKRICKTLGIPVAVKKAKKKAASKKKARAQHPGTRRAVLRLLEEAGVLDMTLRELIS